MPTNELYQVHLLEHINFIEAPKKISKEGMLNLKSNELLLDMGNNLDHHFGLLKASDWTRYPTYKRLRSVISKYYDLNTQTTNSSGIVLTAGSDHAISVLISAIASKSGFMYLQKPNYRGYEHYAALTKVKIIDIEIDNLYAHSTKHLCESINRSPSGIVVIANPHGFTGQHTAYKDVVEILKVAESNGHMLVIDEAYAEFSGTSMARLTETYSNLIVIGSASKAAGLAGARLGWIIANKHLCDYLSRWFSESRISGPTIALANSLYTDKTLLHTIKSRVSQLRSQMVSKLTSLTGWNVYDTATNFILADTNSLDTPKYLWNFLHDRGIYIADLSKLLNFERCVRFTVCDLAHQKHFINAMDEFINAT